MQSVAASEIAGGQPLGEALLALNNAHAQELSWLAPERLEYLVGQAFMARRIGNIDALGFAEVGVASVYGGSRTVRYLSCALAQAAVAGGSASTE